MAASEKTRNGIITVVMKKSLPSSGISASAITAIAAIPSRSSAIGNSAWSAA